MNKNQSHILWFKDLTIEDVPLVGGKNAALGEMYSSLTEMGIKIPNGFAISAAAYKYFLEKARLEQRIIDAMSGLDTHDIRNLQVRGKKIREMILKTNLPKDLAEEIRVAYKELSQISGVKEVDTAVRSSATAEDLPGASFAGQQETYLNIHGANNLLVAVRKCIASLFTDRAISYRVDKGFNVSDVSLSVGVQQMVRSDIASSGVIFTLDTESGFNGVITITGSYGLGEMVVQGKVKPDEFIVFKPTLEKGFESIIARNLGLKDHKLIYNRDGTKLVGVSSEDQARFCVSDRDVLTLADWSLKIEKHFSKKHNKLQPMDIEWAKDGHSGELYIVQARPETVHSAEIKTVYKEYHLKQSGKVLVEGTAVGMKIGTGKIRVISDAKKINQFQRGEVLVTKITDPDWEPIMKIASAIVTDQGGRTSHAAIVSRELGIPCIVGTANATKVLKNGNEVTVDCSTGAGRVYLGKLEFEIKEHRLDNIPETKTHIMVNIGSPNEAFGNHYLPVKGVGLGRLEFIIASMIRVHPNALINYPTELANKLGGRNNDVFKKIEQMTSGYENKTDYYVDNLASGIALIGAAFYPYPVIIRFSDFKTNEYRTLLAGDLYEPKEENPMIGWRGASRYYHPDFTKAFALECQALKKVRKTWGLENVLPMVPFCRTPEEGAKVVKIMAEHGLDRKKDESLKVYVMCEIPSNILLAEEYLEVFDGMSIGSNDLTQLVLGLDRDSRIVAGIANENNPAVMKMIADVVAVCKRKKKYIGICGQAPSDWPDFARFLVSIGIESMSLNPDVVIKTLESISKVEKHG